MHKIFLLLLLIFPLNSLQAAEFDHAAWDGLLKKYVKPIRNGHSTQVDYAGFAKEKGALKSYLYSLARVDQKTFAGWSKPEQLAFLINAYNAWTVELILGAYPNIKSIKDLGSFFASPWKKAFIPILEETRSLDDIEHGLIRGSGEYREPRIHFAVNCASIGCPALRPEAYLGATLERQLEDATRQFLSDRTRNVLQGNTLMLSKIFKWYRSDFETGWRGASTLDQFMLLYRDSLELEALTADRLLKGEIGFGFQDYDWRLNSL